MMDFGDIVRRLLSRDESRYEPAIPDGLVDLSAAITPLESITSSGRPLVSSDPAVLLQLLGKLAGERLSGEATEEELHRILLRLSVFIALVMREIPVIRPDLSVEEFLTDLFSPEKLAELNHSFGGVPYWVDHDGRFVVGIADLPLFAESLPLTDEMKRGFRERKIDPHRPTKWWEAVDEDEIDDEIIIPTTGLQFEIIDAADVVGTVDPLDGFDDFYDDVVEDEEDD